MSMIVDGTGIRLWPPSDTGRYRTPGGTQWCTSQKKFWIWPIKSTGGLKLRTVYATAVMLSDCWWSPSVGQLWEEPSPPLRSPCDSFCQTFPAVFHVLISYRKDPRALKPLLSHLRRCGGWGVSMPRHSPSIKDVHLSQFIHAECCLLLYVQAQGQSYHVLSVSDKNSNLTRFTSGFTMVLWSPEDMSWVWTIRATQ